MKTIDERIEAAAERLYKIAAWQAHEVPWASAPEPERAQWRGEAHGQLYDAFPELFDGTAWLAPTVLHTAMVVAFENQLVEDYSSNPEWEEAKDVVENLVPGVLYEVMRQAHLRRRRQQHQR